MKNQQFEMGSSKATQVIKFVGNRTIHDDGGFGNNMYKKLIINTKTN